MVKGEGFSAQFRFTSLAQGAHLTGSIKLLTRSIRSALALFGGFALRFCAFFLSSRVVVSSLSFPSFPSVLCSCLLLLFLFVSLVCLSVGVSVCWCVASLGWVPFRSVPLLCLLLLAASALPADPRCRPPWRPAGIESESGPPGSPPLGLTPVRWISGSAPWWASSGGLYSAGSRARRGTPSHTVFFCAPGACTARF